MRISASVKRVLVGTMVVAMLLNWTFAQNSKTSSVVQERGSKATDASLPEGVLARISTTRMYSRFAVRHLAFAKEDSELTVVSAYDVMRLDLASGRQLSRWHWHFDRLYSACDGCLAGCGTEWPLKVNGIWEPSKGTLLYKFANGKGHECIGLAEDGTLAVGAHAGQMTIIELPNGKEKRSISIPGYKSPMRCATLCLSPDKTMCAIALHLPPTKQEPNAKNSCVVLGIPKGKEIVTVHPFLCFGPHNSPILRAALAIFWRWRLALGAAALP